MRELLSLRRDEAPIIGEVYRYKGDYLKCVADDGSYADGCKKCYFDVEDCDGSCDGEFGALPRRHFEEVPESEAETAADVKFRHIEETKGKRPFIGERFIAVAGLVEYVNVPNARVIDCACCDLTQRECDDSFCDCGYFYQRVKQ